MGILNNILYFLNLLLIVSCRNSCNENTGPSGLYKCIRIEDYLSYQWATCLTNSYIEMNSDYRHTCRKKMFDVYRPAYCWNQCMMELHDVEEGVVYPDCQCTPTEMTTKFPTATTPLPGICLSPTGNDCLWFRNCLKSKYTCYGKAYMKMIDLASAFCNYKITEQTHLSKNASEWVLYSRKCFQVNMTPVLKPWLQLTCTDLDSKAQSVRSTCLTNPLGQISTCDLNFKDLWGIVWNVRESYYSNIIPSLDVFVEIVHKCYLNKSNQVVKKVKFRLKPTFLRKMTNDMADQFLQNVAVALKWRENDVVWFATLDNDISVILAIRKDVGLDTIRAESSDIDSVLMGLAHATEEGELQFIVNGKLIQLDSMFACHDLDCQETYLLRKATYTGTMFQY